MNIIESYSFLFFDSFFSALILTPHSEMVVRLMTIFPNYNIYLVFTIALMGSVCGSLANWQIGKYFLFLHKTDFFQRKAKEMMMAEQKWHKFLVYVLLFSWLGVVGNPFTTLAGFFRTKIKKFLLVVVAGKIFYYYFLVLCDVDLLHLL